MDGEKREQAKALVRAAAFPDKMACPHCAGSGRVNDNSRWIIHVRGAFTGADWDLEDALGSIDRADAVSWQPGVFGHDLKVAVDGRTWSFDVRRPAVGAST